MLIIFLDLETTGIPERSKDQHYDYKEVDKYPSYKEVDKYPSYKEIDKYKESRIVQLAINIGDEKGNIVKTYNFIVKPDGFEIKNSHIHGITMEMATMTGKPFVEVIQEIAPLFKKASLLVAHNIKFDKNVLLSELYRYELLRPINQLLKIPEFCTCFNTIDIVKMKKYGQLKPPKLIELYKFLFKKDPVGDLHDAIVDTKIMAECFYELIRKEYFTL